MARPNVSLDAIVTAPVFLDTRTHTDSLAAVYGERHYARFYALETIARVPYFAYTSVLHLYEARSWVYEMAAAYRSMDPPYPTLTSLNQSQPQTLGWRRRADLMKIHFAESWNELHHLLIMEELGGNERWGDRVVAVHLAFFYYWVAIAVYMASPETAYNLNEQVRCAASPALGFASAPPRSIYMVRLTVWLTSV